MPTRKTKPKLESTTNYDIFDLHETNRPERRNKKLAESMHKHGFKPSCAIHCVRNGHVKLKIVRGHHRFLEAKRQGLPVYYIVDDDNATIFELEGDNRALWQHKDFAEAYASAGDAEYKALLKFAEDRKMSVGVAAQLLYGHLAPGQLGMAIKQRKFTISDSKQTRGAVKIVDACIAEGIEFAKTGAFVSAVFTIFLVDDFDPEIFISKLYLYPRIMAKRSRRDEYLEEIEALYNHRARGERMPLAFMAIEALKNKTRKHRTSFGDKMKAKRAHAKPSTRR